MNYRDLKGRFASKLSRRQKTYLVAMFILATLPLIDKAQTALHSSDLYARNVLAGKAEASEIPTPSTIEAMKADVLDTLKNCENKEGVALIFDTNKKASLGDYMWQIASVQFRYKQMTGETLSQKDAARLALDDQKARDLSSYVIFTLDVPPSTDWYNCAIRHDLDALAAFINSHE